MSSVSVSDFKCNSDYHRSISGINKKTVVIDKSIAEQNYIDMELNDFVGLNCCPGYHNPKEKLVASRSVHEICVV